MRRLSSSVSAMKWRRQGHVPGDILCATALHDLASMQYQPPVSAGVTSSTRCRGPEPRPAPSSRVSAWTWAVMLARARAVQPNGRFIQQQQARAVPISARAISSRRPVGPPLRSRAFSRARSAISSLLPEPRPARKCSLAPPTARAARRNRPDCAPRSGPDQASSAETRPPCAPAPHAGPPANPAPSRQSFPVGPQTAASAAAKSVDLPAPLGPSRAQNSPG